MSVMKEPGTIPEWTLGWRLNRALDYAGVSVEGMAAELGVSRSTISRWINDRGTPPRSGYVKLWALRTGVDRRWLIQGDDGPGPGPGLGRASVPSFPVESPCVTGSSHSVLRLVA